MRLLRPLGQRESGFAAGSFHGVDAKALVPRIAVAEWDGAGFPTAAVIAAGKCAEGVEELMVRLMVIWKIGCVLVILHSGSLLFRILRSGIKPFIYRSVSVNDCANCGFWNSLCGENRCDPLHQILVTSITFE